MCIVTFFYFFLFLYSKEYARILTRQVTSKNNDSFGRPIGLKAFDLLKEDQLVQLYDLYTEIKNSSQKKD
jgi:hypothetical protein